MRRLLRLVPLAVVLAVLGLAVGSPQAGAITNGTLDTTHSNVGLMYLNDIPVLSLGMCTGTLIAPDKLLVAGHCTGTLTAVGITPEQVSVSFDPTYRLTPEGVIETDTHFAVKGWWTHPGYSFGMNNSTVRIVDDVGVIQLKRPVSGATPADLPPAGFLDERAAKGGLVGQEFTNVGYGMNGLDRSFASPQVNWIWDLQREVSSTPFKSLTPNNLMQFGGACQGDSGGPRFFGDSNLEVAVSSSGDMVCGLEDSSQRLDTPAVHDWLEQFAE